MRTRLNRSSSNDSLKRLLNARIEKKTQKTDLFSVVYIFYQDTTLDYVLERVKKLDNRFYRDTVNKIVLVKILF